MKDKQVVKGSIPMVAIIDHDNDKIKFSMHMFNIMKEFKVTTTNDFSLGGYDGRVIEMFDLKRWDFNCHFESNVLIIDAKIIQD